MNAQANTTSTSRSLLLSDKKARTIYLEGFDFLRVVAIILVVNSHLAPSSAFSHTKLLVGYGVNLFLIIGACLGTLKGLTTRARCAERTEKRWKSTRSIIIHRWMRIVPPVAVYIIVLALVNDIDFGWTTVIHIFLGTNLLFLFELESSSSVYHLWFLGVQEYFLLLWFPILMFAPLRLVGALIVGFILFGIGLALLSIGMDFPELTSHLLLTGNLIPIGMGCALGYVIHRINFERIRGALLGARLPLVFFFVVIVFFESMVRLGYLEEQQFVAKLLPSGLLIAIASMLFLLIISFRLFPSLTRFAQASAFSFLACLIFGLYIWHMGAFRIIANLCTMSGYPLGYLAERVGGPAFAEELLRTYSPINLTFAIVASLVFAVLSWRLVEPVVAKTAKRLN